MARLFLHDDLSLSIPEGEVEIGGERIGRSIGQQGVDLDEGPVLLAVPPLGGYPQTVVADVQGSGLLQPHVAVDASTLIEPTLFKGGIGAHADHIVAAIVQIRRDIVVLGEIAALCTSAVEAVHPYAAVAEDAVEEQGDMLALVFLVDVEGLAVPTHRGLGIAVAHGLVAVRVAALTAEGQLHHEVVGQVDGLPTAVIKLHAVGTLIVDGGRLGEIVEVFRTTAEVLDGVAGMAEVEAPAEVEADLLALGMSRVGEENHNQQHQSQQMERLGIG